MRAKIIPRVISHFTNAPRRREWLGDLVEPPARLGFFGIRLRRLWHAVWRRMKLPNYQQTGSALLFLIAPTAAWWIIQPTPSFLWVPSIVSEVVRWIVDGLSILREHLRPWATPIEEAAGLLLAVQASLTALAVPIVLLAVEVGDDDATPYATTPDVVVNQTPIMPLVVLAFGGLLRLLARIVTPGGLLSSVFDVVVVAATSTLLAVVLIQALRLRRQPLWVKTQAKQLVLERFEEAVSGSIRYRRMNAELARRASELRIEFSPSGTLRPSIESRVPLSVGTVGILADIDMATLEQFRRNLTRRDETELLSDNEPTSTTALEGPVVCLLKGVGDRIGRADDPVVALDSSVFRGTQSRSAERALRDALYVSSQPSPSANVRSLLQRTRRRAMASIRQGDTAGLADALDLYSDLAERFVETLATAGLRYSLEGVSRERSAGTWGWEELAWIREDYSDLLDEGLRHERRQLLERLLVFPTRVASIGIAKGDFALFSSFLRWAPLRIYDARREVPEGSPLHEYLSDQSWRQLIQFGQLVLSAGVRGERSESRLQTIEDAALGVVQVFNELLRTSFERRDRELFGVFIRALSSTVEWYQTSTGRDSTVYSVFKERGDQLRFGMAAWILRSYARGEIEKADLAEWRRLIGPLGDRTRVVSLLDDVMRDDVQSLFGWTWWRLDVEPGRLMSMGYDNLDEFDWVAILELLDLRIGGGRGD